MPWKQEKVFIPHGGQPEGGQLCGILQSRERAGSGMSSSTSSSGRRKIALLCHGQMCHKNSLYQPALANALEMDSFRFDFRGNAESPAPWSIAGFERDIDDLEVVAAWLVHERGYEIDTVIAHSRGSLTTMKWIQLHNHKWRVKRYVPISARYRMKLIHQRDPIYNPAFERDGFYIATEFVRRQRIEFKITPDMIRDFADWDTGYVARGEWPDEVQVLTLAAERDQVMPLEDSVLWARDFESRPGARLSWYMVEGADHMYKGATDEVVQVILDWMRDSIAGKPLPKFWRRPELPLPKGKL